MRLDIQSVDVELRAATAEDVPLLLSLIRAMAAFERLPVSATEDTLRASLFGANPAAHTLLVFVDGEPIGYATYFFTFSTMVGKRGLWLEDLFIDAAHRGKGIGRGLMAHLADVAIQNDCGRFEWIVLDWNEPAIRFYRKLGAEMLDRWRICRLDETQIPRVAAGSRERS